MTHSTSLCQYHVIFTVSIIQLVYSVCVGEWVGGWVGGRAGGRAGVHGGMNHCQVFAIFVNRWKDGHRQPSPDDHSIQQARQMAHHEDFFIIYIGTSI